MLRLKMCSFFLLMSITKSLHAGPPIIPPFVGGVPGMNQVQSIESLRHQARTILYREAIEDLRKNPGVADIEECNPSNKEDSSCIPQKVMEPTRSDTLATKGRKIAILIGNNDYLTPIPRLETPFSDVSTLAETLEKHFGYEATVLKNAAKKDIVQAINKLAKKVAPSDSVLIMYAGHGYLMDDTNMGYWIPVDGSVKTAGNWISNADIAKFLHSIPANQLILVSDSCFSGSLTREHQQQEMQIQDISQIFRKRTVIAFSSGGEEPVYDQGKEGHSIFAWYLINALKNIKDSTLGFKIFSSVRAKISKDYIQQPQYGAVISAGHVTGGEYLFSKE